MKKWFILGLVICFIFVSIIGCGSEKTTTDKGADSKGNDGVKQGDPIKISMTQMCIRDRLYTYQNNQRH